MVSHAHHVGIIFVEDGGAVGGQRFDQLSFGLDDVFHAASPFQMNRADQGNNAYFGLGQVA